MLLASYYPAHADSFPKGMKAYERNDFAEAQRLFLKSTNPEAWFWLASMYQDKNIDGCDLNCAASWYYKAADNGYLKAIPAAAVMFWNAGDHDKAMRLFRYGARWNEPASIQFLQDQREVPPPSDLWLADQERKRRTEIAAQENAAREQEQLGQMLAVIAQAWSGVQAAKANAYPTTAHTSLPPAQLQGVVYLLASQWIEGGNTFCKYTNGTTINIGARVCPMQIRGQ